MRRDRARGSDPRVAGLVRTVPPRPVVRAARARRWCWSPSPAGRPARQTSPHRRRRGTGRGSSRVRREVRRGPPEPGRLGRGTHREGGRRRPRRATGWPGPRRRRPPGGSRSSRPTLVVGRASSESASRAWSRRRLAARMPGVRRVVDQRMAEPPLPCVEGHDQRRVDQPVERGRTDRLTQEVDHVALPGTPSR